MRGQRKPYNPTTAYGRRKLREQAQYDYDNGTPEYRRSVDNNKAWSAFIIFLLIVVAAVIKYSLKKHH